MRTSVILYDRAISRWLAAHNNDIQGAVDALMQHERLIVSADVYDEINRLLPLEVAQTLRERIHLYMNPWGCAAYYQAHAPYPVWQLGPGDVAQPEIILNHSVRCYRMNDAHVRMFLCHWLWPRVRQDDPVKIFLDDMDTDRRWWEGSAADKDRVWGRYDGKPGWRDGAHWNADRIQTVERAAVAMVAEGLDGVIVNGAARAQAARMFECFGLWIRPDQLAAELRAKDVVQIYGLNPDGTWAVTTGDPQYSGYDRGVSFLEVARDAAKMCSVADARLSIAYHHQTGQSLATCLDVPWDEVWP